jgi:hypothetical protein
MRLKWPCFYIQLNQEIKQLRYLFVQQIEARETQNDWVNVVSYQQQWETYF